MQFVVGATQLRRLLTKRLERWERFARFERIGSELLRHGLLEDRCRARSVAIEQVVAQKLGIACLLLHDRLRQPSDVLEQTRVFHAEELADGVVDAREQSRLSLDTTLVG